MSLVEKTGYIDSAFQSLKKGSLKTMNFSGKQMSKVYSHSNIHCRLKKYHNSSYYCKNSLKI